MSTHHRRLDQIEPRRRGLTVTLETPLQAMCGLAMTAAGSTRLLLGDSPRVDRLIVGIDRQDSA